MANGNEMIILLKAENAELKAKIDESKKIIDSLKEKIKNSSDSMGGFFNKLKTAMLAAVSVDAIRRLVTLAGEIDSVSQAFENLAANAQGGSQGLLRAMREASAGTISNLDLMKNANLAMQLMGDEVISRLPEMARIARAAARASGKDVGFMLESLVVATGRQSVLVLDNLGISSATASMYMEQYARSIGKTTMTLNDAEKSQAFFTAAMRAGGELVQRVGLETLTLGERIQQMQTMSSNVASAIVTELMPALETMFFLLTDEDGALVSGVRAVFHEISSAIIQITQTIDAVITSFRMLIAAVTPQRRRQLLSGGPGRPEEPEIYSEDDYDRLRREFEARRQRYETTLERMEGPSFATPGGGRRTPPPTTTPGARGPRREPKVLKESDYLQYVGRQMEAELAQEREKRDQMLAMDNVTAEQRIQIELAYQNKIYEIRRKYNVLTATLQQGTVEAFNNALGGFESQTKELLMSGLRDWDAWRQGMKKILKALVVDLMWAVGKAYLLQAITAGIGGQPMAVTGGGGIVQAIVSKIFSRGYIPSYAAGRIPVLAGGIPSDHFPAFIGAREAVINAESTRANYNLLRAMNANPGQQVGGAMTQNFNFTGNILSDEFIERRVVPKLKDIGRRQGADLYRRQGI